MTRRITVISIVLVVLLGAGAMLYFIFAAPAAPGEERTFFGNLPIIGRGLPPATATPAPRPSPERSPEIKNLIRQVVDKEIIAPTLAADGKNLLYVIRENGHITASDLDGNQARDLTNLTVLEMFDGAWSPKKDRLAMFYYDGGVSKKFINTVATGTPARFLPLETTSAAWSPDGSSIAYLQRKNSETSLIIADAANLTPREVYRTPVPDFTLQWISKNIILLISRPSGLAPSLILRFDPQTRRVETVLSGLNGAVVTPIPGGTGFVLSTATAEGRPRNLVLYAFKDHQVIPLNIATIADKCVFSPDAKKLYCGVPKNMGAGVMPDDWYRGEESFFDAIMEVDLATNQVKTLLENEADVDAISLFAAKDGKYLFFADKKTSTLWRIALASEKENLEKEKR